MKIARLLCLLVSIAAVVPGQKKPDEKKLDVQVLELKAKQSHRQLALDGRVRVVAPRSIRGLTIFFDFLANDGMVLATEKTKVDEELLAPGAESSIHADTDILPRSVGVRLRAADFRQRELAVGNAGPFTIE